LAADLWEPAFSFFEPGIVKLGTDHPSRASFGAHGPPVNPMLVVAAGVTTTKNIADHTRVAQYKHQPNCPQYPKNERPEQYDF
jgi:hypothetical protein